MVLGFMLNMKSVDSNVQSKFFFLNLALDRIIGTFISRGYELRKKLGHHKHGG